MTSNQRPDHYAPRRYRVRHSTIYTYDDDVEACYERGFLRPLETWSQQVVSNQVDISPEPEVITQHVDHFGNHSFYVEIRSTHRELVVSKTAFVDVAWPRPVMESLNAFTVAEAAIAQGAGPDTISSDIHAVSGNTPGMPYLTWVMSKFLALGFTLEQVVTMATLNPAAVIERVEGLGTLQPGAPGDVSVLERVDGPVSFVDSFGAPRSGGRGHKGVDMLSPRGTPSVAPVSGTVTHRGNGIGGLSWHLNGDDGNYYYGTHLDSYANQGAGHVEAGTVIGYVGDTGNAKGTPHLHFEIYPAGVEPGDVYRAVDPWPWLRDLGL